MFANSMFLTAPPSLYLYFIIIRSFLNLFTKFTHNIYRTLVEHSTKWKVKNKKSKIQRKTKNENWRRRRKTVCLSLHMALQRVFCAFTFGCWCEFQIKMKTKINRMTNICDLFVAIIYMNACTWNGPATRRKT